LSMRMRQNWPVALRQTECFAWSLRRALRNRF